MKKILFILARPPHSGLCAQEGLDIIMTAAAFDQEVNILLLDGAVFFLKDQQSPENIGLKDIASSFAALPLYGVNEIHIESELLEEYGLSITQTTLPVVSISRDVIGHFCRQFDQIISI